MVHPNDTPKDLLDLQVIEELLEFVAVKLCSIVGYDGVEGSGPSDYVLVNELLNLCGCDERKRFYFNPFREVVNGHYCVLRTTSSFGKLAD